MQKHRKEISIGMLSDWFIHEGERKRGEKREKKKDLYIIIKKLQNQRHKCTQVLLTGSESIGDVFQYAPSSDFIDCYTHMLIICM